MVCVEVCRGVLCVYMVYIHVYRVYVGVNMVMKVYKGCINDIIILEYDGFTYPTEDIPFGENHQGVLRPACDKADRGAAEGTHEVP